MSVETHERALEDEVVRVLTEVGGWTLGAASDFDPLRGLFPKDLLAWMADAHPAVWAKLSGLHGARLGEMVLDGAEQALREHTTPRALRGTMDFHGESLRLAAFPGDRPDAQDEARVARNRCVVYRQVRFVPGGEQSIDLVLALNGVPVVTIELKNRLAASSPDAYAAVAQYRARPPAVPLFDPLARCMAHFAVDQERVLVTTRVEGPATRFVPFDRGGADGGAGNRADARGASTSFLWYDVLARQSLLEIVQRFAQRALDKRTRAPYLLFPRYHQLDAVRCLVADVRARGVGKRYLVQHSAGSGKSNTIAWLAWQLTGLHDAAGARVFDQVLVMTDRTVLDAQLQWDLEQFDKPEGMLRDVSGAKDLEEALRACTARLLVVTQQTFPFVREAVAGQAGRRYAMIFDEAHGGHGGRRTEAIDAVLGVVQRPLPATKVARDDDDRDDDEDAALAYIRDLALARQGGNQSVFAFTATPPPETLARFAPEMGAPFHLYSMRQAIEEGFIVDVRRGYLSQQTLFTLRAKSGEDPVVDRRLATQRLMRFVQEHRHAVEQKAAWVVDHFLQNVAPQLGGEARAMVVCRTRATALRFHRAVKAQLAAHGSRYSVLVAFSGSLPNPAGGKEEITEATVNGFAEKELTRRFGQGDARILVVANKYQTGFDEPLLLAMYVDRKLADVQAVQTLSRLNRPYPGKDIPLVVDFVNARADIDTAFGMFLQGTTLAAPPDPRDLIPLRIALDASELYTDDELDAYARAMATKLSSGELQAALLASVGAARDRFRAALPAQRDQRRGIARDFIERYALFGHLLESPDADLELRFQFLRTLVPLLGDAQAPISDFDPATLVELARYRIVPRAGAAPQTAPSGPVTLGLGVSGAAPGASPQVRLSAVLQAIENRYGVPVQEREVQALNGVLDAMRRDEDVQAAAVSSPEDAFVDDGAQRAKVRAAIRGMSDDVAALRDRLQGDLDALDKVVRTLLQNAYTEARRDNGVRLARLSALRNGLEPRLRSLASRELSRVHGAQWRAVVDGVLPDNRRRQLRGFTGDIVFDKLFLPELLQLYRQQWSAVFAVVFEAHRDEAMPLKDFEVQLSLVDAHREDAHAGRVSEDVLKQVEIAVGRLMAALDRADVATAD